MHNPALGGHEIRLEANRESPTVLIYPARRSFKEALVVSNENSQLVTDLTETTAIQYD